MSTPTHPTLPHTVYWLLHVREPSQVLPGQQPVSFKLFDSTFDSADISSREKISAQLSAFTAGFETSLTSSTRSMKDADKNDIFADFLASIYEPHVASHLPGRLFKVMTYDTEVEMVEAQRAIKHLHASTDATQTAVVPAGKPITVGDIDKIVLESLRLHRIAAERG